jgi:hypothetical protein
MNADWLGSEGRSLRTYLPAMTGHNADTSLTASTSLSRSSSPGKTYREGMVLMGQRAIGCRGMHVVPAGTCGLTFGRGSMNNVCAESRSIAR